MTSQHADQELASVAYEAYRMQTGGVSLRTEESLPSWADMDSKYQDAWIAAARAVEMEVRGQRETISA
jgi:hypothetical protein